MMYYIISDVLLNSNIINDITCNRYYRQTDYQV